jgi:hypothetical protein
MLAAVAAASPDTTNRLPARKANMPVSMVINQKNPAALALKSGDVSAIGSVITAVFTLVPPYVSD